MELQKVIVTVVAMLIVMVYSTSNVNLNTNSPSNSNGKYYNNSKSNRNSKSNSYNVVIIVIVIVKKHFFFAIQFMGKRLQQCRRKSRQYKTLSLISLVCDHSPTIVGEWSQTKEINDNDQSADSNSTLFSTFSLSRYVEIGHRQSRPVDECSEEERGGFG